MCCVYIKESKHYIMDRLHSTLKWLLYESTTHELCDATVLARKIGEAGLVFDDRRSPVNEDFNIYGDDAVYMLSEEVSLGFIRQGLWQTPSQFASALIYLSDKGVKQMAEIGPYAGWTLTVTVAYLLRFGLISAYAYDVNPFCAPETQAIWKQYGLPITYLLNTPIPEDIMFDYIFIDGDHSYPGVKFDYETYKTRARMLGFHDINDFFCPGVVMIWDEIKSQNPNNVVEFTSHPNGFPMMGIGIIHIV